METSGGNVSQQPVVDESNEINPTMAETSGGGIFYQPNFFRYQGLQRAIFNGDWQRVEQLYERDPNAARTRITVNSDTPLMVAVKSRQISITDLERLISFLDPDDLAAKNKKGNTALHEATIVGNLEAANLLFKNNQEVLRIANQEGYLPIHTAAAYGQRKLVHFLLKKYDPDRWTRDDIVLLLHLTIKSKILDVANGRVLDRLQKEDCSLCVGGENVHPLFLIAQDPLAFPSSVKDWSLVAALRV